MPILADRDEYIASESSMYRILGEEGLNAHRAASRPARHTKPREYVARGESELEPESESAPPNADLRDRI